MAYAAKSTGRVKNRSGPKPGGEEWIISKANRRQCSPAGTRRKPRAYNRDVETVLSVCLGVALAAACGFRVFVPLLVVSTASRVGWLTLGDSFGWIGSTPALITFAVATILEIGAYYVPWLDNLLDSIAGPAAVVAGVLVSAAVLTEVDPLVKWTLAIVAGGGAAGAVQAATTGARGLSTVTTLGAANPILATAELGGSLLLSLISLLVPVLALILVFGFLAFVVFRLARRPRRA